MNAPTFTFGTDARLLVTRWDKSAASVTGRPAVEVLGKKYHRVLPRIVSTDDRDAVAVVIRTGKSLALKGHYFNTVTGQVKADIRIEPKRAPGTATVGATVEVNLHARPAEKTGGGAGATQRLIDTGKTATAFVHSVRNPLNAIKGAVVYLKNRYSQEGTLVEFAGIIEEEIARLDDFISRFLSTSASESQLLETDVNSLMRKIESLTCLQARARGIGSSYTYDAVPMVMANSFHLEQAILNVINNAIEALSPGQEFSVRTLSERSLDEDWVVVEISDTGPGMGLGGAPRKGRRKGKGFGLLITREILKQNGGWMEIKSRPGGGTTVRIFLPVLKGLEGEYVQG